MTFFTKCLKLRSPFLVVSFSHCLKEFTCLLKLLLARFTFCKKLSQRLMMMLMLTGSTLPKGFEIVETFGLTTMLMPIKVSDTSIIEKIFAEKTLSVPDFLDALQNNAPKEANIIYDIQHSIAMHQFKEGVLLYISAFGTAGIYKETGRDGE